MLKTLQYDGFRWFFKQASTMAENSSSGLFVEEGFVNLMIPISRLQTIDIGIKEALAPLINHYCDSLHGILIAYSRLRVLSPHIDLSDAPNELEEVRIHGTFVIFRPKPNQDLEGVITRVDPHYIGCLVLKNFAASLQSESGSNINFMDMYHQGQDIKFKFAKLENHNGISSMRGYLTDEDILTHREQQPDKDSVKSRSYNIWNSEVASGSDGIVLRGTPRSSKKHFRTDNTRDNVVYPGMESSIMENSYGEPKSKKKKHNKRRKILPESDSVSEQISLVEPGSPMMEPTTVEDDTTLSKKERKKRRRESAVLEGAEESSYIHESKELDSEIRNHVEYEVTSPPKKKHKKNKKDRSTESIQVTEFCESPLDTPTNTPETDSNERRRHKTSKIV